VYVSAYFDGAIVAFARNASDGSLSYLDAIREGQRLFEEYEDLPLSTASIPVAESSISGSPPVYPYTLPFRDVSAPPQEILHFTIEEKSFMAVSSSSLRWDIADGALTVFEWQGGSTGPLYPISVFWLIQPVLRAPNCVAHSPMVMRTKPPTLTHPPKP
jgi:hypothetical protein